MPKEIVDLGGGNETDSTERQRSILCYAEPVETFVIRITVNGKLALTISQAADRLGLPASGLRRDLAREPNAPKPAGHVDGRTPVYLASDIKEFGKRDRPGKGSPGKPRATAKRKEAA